MDVDIDALALVAKLYELPFRLLFDLLLLLLRLAFKVEELIESERIVALLANRELDVVVVVFDDGAAVHASEIILLGHGGRVKRFDFSVLIVEGETDATEEKSVGDAFERFVRADKLTGVCACGVEGELETASN